jgi:hypothetical protein
MYNIKFVKGLYLVDVKIIFLIRKINSTDLKIENM